MEDDELAQIRARRLAELQGKSGGGPSSPVSFYAVIKQQLLLLP